MRNMIHGSMCRALGASDSVTQCPIWERRQGVHLIIDSNRANEYTKQVTSVQMVLYKGGLLGEIQAKVPALDDSELPFFSSPCLWWRGY